MKNIFVLGGTGFLGRHLCEKLAREGWRVTVPTRRRSNAVSIQHLPALNVVEVDVHDETSLTQALAGHNAVVNLVAILHGDQRAFEHAHVALPQKLARACIANSVSQVVHVSALGADSRHSTAAPSMYLRTKGEGEAVLLQAALGGSAGAAADKGFDLSILRPSVIFGDEDKFLNVFAKLQKLLPVMPLAGAGARFQPVWVQDVASAIVACLKSGSEDATPRIIEVAGPQVFTLKELVQMSAQLSGICGGLGRPVIALPMWIGRLQATLMGLAPGEPLMSPDNLDSMKVDNVSSGKLPGLASLGIQAAELQPIAQAYLRR